MSTEGEAKASDHADTSLSYEERKEQCKELIEKVVHMRLRYPKHIKKIDLQILHEEQKLLEKYLNQKIPVESARNIIPETIFDDSIVEECRQMEKEDLRLRNELTDQLGNLQKITEQIRNDDVHRVTREPIDSKTIVSRAKKQKMCTK